MTPAAVLDVRPGDRALDLCAAPGGKSTELAAGLQGEGVLFANDISASRAKALLKNLELSGASNICVLSETPKRLAERFPEFFDRILVDAPCSGEGMFRRDPGMIRSYAERGPEYYMPLQREIVSEAVRMLAPGGRLLYSTCTFDEGENEGCLRFVLDAFPQMRLVEIEKREGFSPGIGMPECARLFPHKIRGEGHFLALLEKNPGAGMEEETQRKGVKRVRSGNNGLWTVRRALQRRFIFWNNGMPGALIPGASAWSGSGFIIFPGSCAQARRRIGAGCAICGPGFCWGN